MKDRIKEIRRACSQTQQSFAESLNVSKSTIEAIEYGRRDATDRIISDICRVYNVNEEWLRNGTGEMFQPKDRNSEIADIVAMMFKGDESDFRFQLTKLLYEMDADEIAAFKNIIVKMAATIEKDPPK